MNKQSEERLRNEIAVKVGFHWNNTSPGELTDSLTQLVAQEVRKGQVEVLEEMRTVKCSKVCDYCFDMQTALDQKLAQLKGETKEGHE